MHAATDVNGYKPPFRDFCRRLSRRRVYECEETSAFLRWLGIEPHIAVRRTPHGSGLGKVR